MKIDLEFANEFLKKYDCCKGDYDKATKNSINASIQRNRIYIRNISTGEKDIIKKKWKTLLEEYANQIKNKRPSVRDWSKLLLDYQKELNSISKKTEFKISHCQKSLSLYLKYIWIFNDLKKNFEPPVCVIDSKILEISKIKNIKWTKINSIEEYNCILKSISNQLAGKSFANWELEKFGNLLRK